MSDDKNLAKAKELYAKGDYAGVRKLLEPIASNNQEAANMLGFLNMQQSSQPIPSQKKAFWKQLAFIPFQLPLNVLRGQGSNRWVSCLGAVFVWAFICMGFSFCMQTAGIVPSAKESQATSTAEKQAEIDTKSTAKAYAGETATIIALTPTDTHTPTDTPTNTDTPTDTLTPSDTYTPTDTFTPSDTPTYTLTPTDTDIPTDTYTPSDTPTPSNTYTPTDTPLATLTPTPDIQVIAKNVVLDLHDTDIHDGDFRDSTSAIPGRAVVKIYLSESEKSDKATVAQARHDYPILVCDLIAAGFTERIAITGVAVLTGGDEGKTIEVALNTDAIASLDCDNPGGIDIFAVADSVYVLPSLIAYVDMSTTTPKPLVTQTPRPPTTTTRYINTTTANVRACASTNCDIVGSLPFATKIETTGKDGEWYVFTYKGETAYVFGEITSATRPSSNSGGSNATRVPTIAGATRPPSENPTIQATAAAVCECFSGDIYNCTGGSFSTVSQAQACYNYCWDQTGRDVHGLDGSDNDGQVCESGVN